MPVLPARVATVETCEHSPTPKRPERLAKAFEASLGLIQTGVNQGWDSVEISRCCCPVFNHEMALTFSHSLSSFSPAETVRRCNICVQSLLEDSKILRVLNDLVDRLRTGFPVVIPLLHRSRGSVRQYFPLS